MRTTVRSVIFLHVAIRALGGVTRPLPTRFLHAVLLTERRIEMVAEQLNNERMEIMRRHAAGPQDVSGFVPMKDQAAFEAEMNDFLRREVDVEVCALTLDDFPATLEPHIMSGLAMLIRDDDPHAAAEGQRSGDFDVPPGAVRQ